MKVYKCVKRFFSAELERYIPVDALIYKWEKVSKMSVDYGSKYDLEPIEYDDPFDVDWVDALAETEEWLVLDREIQEEDGGYIDTNGNTGGPPAVGFQGFQGFQGSQVSQDEISISVSSGQTEVVDASTTGLTNWTIKVSSLEGIESLKVGAINDTINSNVHYSITERMGYRHVADWSVNESIELTVSNNTVNSILITGRREGF